MPCPTCDSSMRELFWGVVWVCENCGTYKSKSHNGGEPVVPKLTKFVRHDGPFWENTKELRRRFNLKIGDD